MKRFMLFEGLHYYPNGGIGDLTKDSDDLLELIELAKENDEEWYHIYDTSLGETIAEKEVT